MITRRVNIGELISEKVEERGLSKAKFAESIGIARQNVDKTVFAKHGIDTDLLCVICEVLDYNFFECFTPCNQNDYISQEIKATVIIEMGTEKQERAYKFVFGKNNVEIK